MEIDTREILRYSGFRGASPDPKTAEMIEELKKEYLSEKIITIFYEENIENEQIDFEILEKSDNKVIFKVDTNKISMDQILKKFMKYGNIIDLEAIPVSLEEVIYDIYTKN